LSIVAGVLRLLAEVAQDAGVIRADETVGNSVQAVADTNWVPGVAVVIRVEGPDGTAGIRLAGRHRGVFGVTVDRSPATMALPAAALPSLDGTAWVGGIPNPRRWRRFVRRYPGVDLPGRLVKAVGSQARCSLCPFCMPMLRLCRRGDLTSVPMGQNRR